MALKAFGGGVLFGASLGEGSPSILALHGWGRDHHDFDRVLEGFDAVALDLPGFGASPAPTAVWGAEEYAAAIMTMMDTFEAPPVLVGHSFGGRVAVALAANFPDAVDSLVLIGVPLLSPPDRPHRRAPLPYRLIRWAHRRSMISEEHIEAARQRFGSADYRAATGIMRDILVKAVNETYERQLGALEVPTRLLWGRSDSAVPYSVAERAFTLLEGSEVPVTLQFLDGVGHHVMAEAPDAVRELLSEQLDRRA